MLAFGGEFMSRQTLASVVGRAARYLRARRAKWTADTDRHFHDEIFERQDYDPFDPRTRETSQSAASPTWPPSTCDTRTWSQTWAAAPAKSPASWRADSPRCRFAAGITARPPSNADGDWRWPVGSVNVSFDRVDLTSVAVDRSVGLVTMFDAFHHVLDPKKFLALNAHVNRWFLIEPAGDALGRWRYSRDFDWVLLELDKLRWRLEHELGVAVPTASSPSPQAGDAAAAVEFRYALAE